MAGFEPRDYWGLARFSSLQTAADTIAMVKSTWDEKGQLRHHVVATRSGFEFQVEGTDPALTGDGRYLFYLFRCALYRLDLTKDAPVPEAVADPDGNWETVSSVTDGGILVFAQRQEIREVAPEGCSWDLPLVAEAMPCRSDPDHGFRKQYRYRLCTCPSLDILPATPRILRESEKSFEGLCLLWDGAWLLFHQETWQLLQLQDTTAPSPVLTEEAANTPMSRGVRPCPAPDMSYVLIGTPDGMETALHVLPLAPDLPDFTQGENAPAGLSLDCYMDRGRLSHSLIAPAPEPDSFYVCATDDHVPGLWLLRVDRVRGTIVWYTPNHDFLVTDIAPYGGQTESFGGHMAALAGTCQSVPSLRILSTLRFQVSHPGEEDNAFLSSRTVSRPRRVSVQSLDGRAEIQGFLHFPQDTSQPVPLLVWVHGGPAGCWTEGLNLEIQSAVSAGFAVLLPNPRGSTGCGRKYASPEHAFDGGAATDILTLLDEVLRQYPELDRNRMGVLGGSYGGYMAAYLAGTTSRFRACVVQKGVTNWLYIHFCSSQAGQPVFDDYRDFQDFLVDSLRISPVFQAQDVSCPTLIIHGEEDQQVPAACAHQYYTALKDCHPQLPVRLMLFPHLNHDLQGGHLQDYLQIQEETLLWLRRYVKGENV